VTVLASHDGTPRSFGAKCKENLIVTDILLSYNLRDARCIKKKYFREK